MKAVVTFKGTTSVFHVSVGEGATYMNVVRCLSQAIFSQTLRRAFNAGRAAALFIAGCGVRADLRQVILLQAHETKNVPVPDLQIVVGSTSNIRVLLNGKQELQTDLEGLLDWVLLDYESSQLKGKTVLFHYKSGSQPGVREVVVEGLKRTNGKRYICGVDVNRIGRDDTGYRQYDEHQISGGLEKGVLIMPFQAPRVFRPTA